MSVASYILPELKQYIEREILPRYVHFDAAHQLDHVETVIRESLLLAAYYPVDKNMVYAIAAYHDTGLSEGRKLHHIVSGKIVRSDEYLQRFFTEEQIEMMAQAVEDHRASNNHAPRSIYGKIVAEADRLIDAETIVQRTIQYTFDHYPGLDKEGNYQRFCTHMKEKYAEGGYLKLWIPESQNAVQLRAFQELLKDPQKTRNLFDEVWNKLKE